MRVNARLHAASAATPGMNIRCFAMPVSDETTTPRDASSQTTSASIRSTSPDNRPYAGPIQSEMKDSPRSKNVIAIGAEARVAIFATRRITSQPDRFPST